MSQLQKITSHVNGRDNSNRKRILRIKDLVTDYGTNRMQIYRWEKNDDFPKAIRLSERTKGWWRHEVEEWFENRKCAA